VRSLAVGNGLLYAGGSFTTADGTSRPYLSAYSLTTGARSTTWLPTPNDHVNGVDFANNALYVAGSFSSINGASNGHMRALDPNTGAVAASFKPPVPYEAFAIAAGEGPSAGNVYAAVGGPGGRAMAFTTAGALEWTVTTDGDTQAINVMDHTV